MFVDHIVELKDGGAPLDRSNVWLLCTSHHAAKTASERAKRNVVCEIREAPERCLAGAAA